MYHSLIFGKDLTNSKSATVNTWDDWHLIPSSRPTFSMPQPSLNLISIPGKSGTLDITEMNGETMIFGDRTGSFDFIVENGYWNSWAEAYSVIARYVHGKKLQVMLEDDDKYYYEGRFMLNEWRSNQNWSTISIGYQVGPFKRNRYPLGDDWLWDELDFNNSTTSIASLSDLSVPSTGLTVKITGFGYRTVPIITRTGGASCIMQLDGGNEIPISPGRNVPTDAVITEGDHTLFFRGVGSKITITYYGGSL